MTRRAVILGFILFAVIGFIGWQFAACYLANSGLQSDMQDLAVQSPFRIGLAEAASEDDLRAAVIAKAKDRGIQLQPRQVTVQRVLTSDELSIALSADYDAHVNLFVDSVALHFGPSASHSAKVVVK